MSVKETLIHFFFSCDGVKGYLTPPEELLASNSIRLFNGLGRQLSQKNKKARLKLINKVDSKQLLISIVLPVLDSELTIKEAIKSIQKQSYKHWELIIVDDGSTDDTAKIIKKYADLDSRIKCYKNAENKGAAYSRNVGLHYAKGEFITFHDADDKSHVERLEYQLAKILSNPRNNIVVVQCVRINHKNEILTLNGRRKRNYVSGMLFKRSLMTKVGYFKPLKISEDSEYYERLVATFGKKSRKFICKTLYYALFNPKSLLFSNANVEINGNSIHYKILDEERVILKNFRAEHKLIHEGKLSPYQEFSVDISQTKPLL